MSWPSIIILAISAAAVAVIVWGQHRHVAPLLRRPSALPVWREFDPLAPAEDVRAFLHLVMAAFALRAKHHEVFRPGDRILDLYRAVTPPGWTLGDQCELEALVSLLKSKYGLDLVAVWRDDLTFGELFTLARSCCTSAAST